MHQSCNGRLAKQLHNLVKQRMGQTLAQLELTQAQSWVLKFLVQRQDELLCPRDVEEFFSLSHATVSGILCRLEDKGFLTFQPDPGDRRRKRIAVTDKALEAQNQIRSTIDQVEAQMTAGFTPEEQAQLPLLLERAIRNLGGELCSCHTKEESHSC